MCDSTWHGCYSGQYDLWTPESYTHPAKLSPALAFRILGHLEELGLLRPGQTVLDPMCGIGTVLLAAAVKGHPAVGVELEPRFVSLAQANADRIASKGFGAPIRIIQGDARHLSKLLQERGLCSVSSPPYGEAINSTTKGGIDWFKCAEGPRPDKLLPTASHGTFTLNYGITPGQIGSLPNRPVVVTSPPYAEAQSGGGIMQEGYTKPYQKDKIGGGNVDPVGKRTYAAVNQGQTEGQIANLPDKTTGETYLSAMREVYTEIAKVADVLAIVLKNPTRNGKLRRLDLDTIAVLEATGWRICCQHHAVLFEEQEQGHLLDGSVKTPKGRLSFFKRLSYAKGSPVADHEDILVCVRDHEDVIFAEVAR